MLTFILHLKGKRLQELSLDRIRSAWCMFGDFQPQPSSFYSLGSLCCCSWLAGRSLTVDLPEDSCVP